MLADTIPATRAWHRAMVLAALALFVALTVYRLDAPGLYADEMIFAPVAYHALGQCDVVAGVTAHIGRCFPTYLDPPYLGALKAYLHAPLLKLFGPSIWTLRMPSILLSALSLSLLFPILRRAVDAHFAAIAVLCLALDPAFVFHTHFDWGPFVISALCRIGLLGLLWRWLDSGRPGDLAWAALMGLVGLYDKLNFLWVLVAFAIAVLVVDRRRFLAHLRAQPTAHLRILIAAAAIVAWVIYNNVLPAMRLEIPGGTPVFVPAQQWDKLVTFYNDAYAASFARNWISENPGPVPAWPWRLLIGQFVALGLLALTRPWRHSELLPAWRGAAFIAAALTVMLAMMWATRQLAGAHHLMAAWPFPTLLLLLEVDLAARLLRKRATAAGGPSPTVLLAGAALALVCVGIPAHTEQRALWRGEYGFRSPLDPNMKLLSQAVNRRPAGKVVATDWGLHEPLLSMAPKAQRSRFLNLYPSFVNGVAGDAAEARWLRDTYFPHGSHWLISFAAGREMFPASRGHLAEFAAFWGGCLSLDEALPGVDGRPLFEIWRYESGPSCAAPAQPAGLTPPAA